MPKDTEREHRITYEIIVDAYDEDEVMMGWYYHFDDIISAHRPIPAQWHRTKRGTSQAVEIVGMPDEEDCERELFVEVLYREGDLSDTFSARAIDLQTPTLSPEHPVAQALDDWRYWHKQGA